MTSPYGTNKLLHHRDLLGYLREGKVPPSPRVVHFMPELGCPHACQFCSYGHRRADDGEEQYGWKNMELMDERARLTWEQASRFLDEFEAMGGRAVELTGGGEPLMWPSVDLFLDRMTASPLELALVSNGTLLSPARAKLFGQTPWKWARISIDAGSEERYVAVRRVNKREWKRAWRAVELLALERDRGDDPEQRVGVGFVVDHGNYMEVYEGCRRAKEAGASNIRISIAFTPAHLARFPRGALEEARTQAATAKSVLDSPGFEVVDLVSERTANIASPRQDYPRCPIKDVLCVVGGDANVYSCCSLAFNKLGLIGSIEPHGFRELWERVMPRWSSGHDPRRDCPVECLYERRNKDTLALLELPPEEADRLRKAAPRPPHVNYI